jgi:hypothetical protein
MKPITSPSQAQTSSDKHNTRQVITSPDNQNIKDWHRHAHTIEVHLRNLLHKFVLVDMKDPLILKFKYPFNILLKIVF